MLRCAQMLLGHTLLRQQLGPDWRVPLSPSHRAAALQQDKKYQQILRMFCDEPGPPHVFSIHHIVQAGMRYDKLPGEWFEPSISALVLRDLVHVHQSKLKGRLVVYVTRGDVIYLSTAENLCRDTSLDDTLLAYTTAQDHTSPRSPRTMSSSSAGPATAAVPESTATTATTAVGAEAESVSEANLKRLSVRSQTRLQLHQMQQQLQQHQQPLSTVFTGTNSILPQKCIDQEVETPLNKQDPFFDPLFRPPPSTVLPWSKSLLILIPLRLGITTISAQHLSELQFFLRYEHCVGVLGGRPNHAIYFTGFYNPYSTSRPATYASNSGNNDAPAEEGDNENAEWAVLLGHDPHTTYSASHSRDPFHYHPDDPQTNVSGSTSERGSNHARDDTNGTNGSDSSCKFPPEPLVDQLHVSRFVTLPVSQLDPSLALGFCFLNRNDFDSFVSMVRFRVAQRIQRGQEVLFQVEHAPPAYYFDEGEQSEASDKEEAEVTSGSNSDNSKSNSSTNNVKKSVTVSTDDMLDYPEDFDENDSSDGKVVSKVDKAVLRMMLGDESDEDDGGGGGGGGGGGDVATTESRGAKAAPKASATKGIAANSAPRRSSRKSSAEEDDDDFVFV